MRVNATLIRELRTAKGWSQETLAETAGLNLRTVQRIEQNSSASLHSKSSLATALGVEITELDGTESRFSPCPECRSADVFACSKQTDSSTIGGDLLPGLAPGKLSAAKMQAVVCADCGYLRYFVDPASLEKMKSSRHWAPV